MAIDFPPNAVNPNPPQDGDEYLDQASGTTWVYDTTSNSWTLQTSGSPGGGGTAFKGQHDFTQALLPAPAAEAGDIYSQADIGGATGTVDAVYNGIAGEDIEEGMLVLYTGSSWTFLITTPGYPDLGDGQGSTMDERYVLVIGDNMSGDLTLGTDKITLDATNGNADFAGNIITGGNPNNGQNLGSIMGATGGLFGCRENADLIFAGFQLGQASPTSSIYANGNAKFTNSVTSPTHENRWSLDGHMLLKTYNSSGADYGEIRFLQDNSGGGRTTLLLDENRDLLFIGDGSEVQQILNLQEQAAPILLVK